MSVIESESIYLPVPVRKGRGWLVAAVSLRGAKLWVSCLRSSGIVLGHITAWVGKGGRRGVDYGGCNY